MSTVAMQTLAFVQHSSSVSGSQLFISADLRLHQRTPLPHQGVHAVYNVGVFKQQEKETKVVLLQLQLNK